jgi:hypothetical protein
VRGVGADDVVAGCGCEEDEWVLSRGGGDGSEPSMEEMDMLLPGR